MNSTEIANLVNERAARYGARNPQQLEQISSRLRALPEAEVFKGLLQVFTNCEPPPQGSTAQELAGRLLFEVRPKGDIDLKPFMRQALPRYELSVEQLPLYLAELLGKSAIVEVLAELSSETELQPFQRAIRTMHFWLRQSQVSGAHDGA